MKGLIITIVIAVASFLPLCIVSTSRGCSSVKSIAQAGANSALSKIEAQLDQGELALVRIDEAYRKAEQRLVQLKALKLDSEVGMKQAEARAADFEKQGLPDLAEKNREQAEFFRKQSASYDLIIEKRTLKMQQVRDLRMRTKEDVRLIRIKISHFQATKEALDNSDIEENLESVEQLVSQMNKNCNLMAAEVEVMNMED